MLDRTFDTYFPPSSPRAMFKLSQYIGDLNLRRLDLLKRQQAVGVESMAVRLLRQILTIAGLPTLAEMPSDYDRYTNGLLFTQEDLERLFDPVIHGVKTGVFIAHTGTLPCREFHIPIRQLNYLASLPFDKGWDEWAAVRPVRLLDIDSDELTFHIYLDKIQYKVDQPTLAVIGIDVVALVLQYLCYRRSADGDQLSVVDYLHRYVLAPGLLTDLQNLWLRRQYLKILGGGESDADRKWSKNNVFGQVGARYREAMTELATITDTIATGGVRASVFVSSLPLADGLTGSYVQNLLTETTVTDAQRYRWIEYLRDREWIRLALLAQHKRPSTSEAMSLMRGLTRDLSLLNMTRFWEAIRQPAVEEFVRQDFLKLQMLVDKTA